MQTQFFKRRMIAFAIDFFISLLLSFPLLLFILLISDYAHIDMNVLDKFYTLCFMIIFSLKDTICKNGSIGKRLVSIRIARKNTLEIPSRKVLIIRGFVTVFLYVFNIPYVLIKGETFADKLSKTIIQMG